MDRFHPRSCSHHPRTRCYLRHHRNRLAVRFEVDDRFVRSIQTGPNAPVYTDSCVELFITPQPGQGYLHFEVNAGGALLLHRMQEPAYPGDRRGEPVTADWAGEIAIAHSLPRMVDPEMADPVRWWVEYGVPMGLFDAYFPGMSIQEPWAGNAYKCGDHTSHPHWASWAPIGERLDFHQPARFRLLAFEPVR